MENNNENKEVFNPYLDNNEEPNLDTNLNNPVTGNINEPESEPINSNKNKIISFIKQNTYITVMILATILVLILGVLFIPKMFKNPEQENISMSEKVDIEVPELYISRFFDTSPDIKHLFQIKLLNKSKSDVFSQTIVTIWGKAICDIPSEGLISEEYVDASHFHILDEKEQESFEKYYILETSESVFSSNYNESMGKIIGVRYFIPNENWATPENGIEEIINEYIYYLDETTPFYFYSNIEVTVSVKCQGKTERNAEWLTKDTAQIYSNSFDGAPLEYSNPDVSEPSDTTTSDSLNNEDYSTPAVSETTIETESTTAPIVTETTQEDVTLIIPSQTENNSTVTEVSTESTVIQTEPIKIFPEAMSINTGSTTLKVGDTFQFVVTLTPENTTETAISWISKNPDIATVDANGLVTAISSGTATITVSTVNGMSYDCVVNVEAPQDPNIVTALMLNAASITMESGQSYTLSLSVLPETITSVMVTFSTTDANVATVSSNGTITGISPGTAIITVTTDNNISSSCEVIVK